MKKILLGIMLSATLTACGGEEKTVQEKEPDIQAARLDANIQILASDEFEGRSPSSPGEEKTVNFLKQKFQEAGLKPGNGDSYFQEMDLVEITANPEAVMTIAHVGGRDELKYGPEYMAWTKRMVEQVSVDESEMVFVGYGIVAPEYGWNDYEGVDVKGKTVVILINDPGFATKDPALFTGKAMTYYGRWTYKFEEAARQGADAALIIHETAPAAYPWAVVEGSWSGPQFSLATEDKNMNRLKVEGWIPGDYAEKLFKTAGLDYAALKETATKADFKAVSLKAQMSLTLNNRIRQSKSRNVVAVLPGTDRADEYIIHMAHWDHLGKDESLEGDQIYNGALDNATGTAGLIELAHAYASAPTPPRRSVMFLAVTAEEQGLLGSQYYAEHPLVPLEKTVAAINMDVLNHLGPTRDVTVIGYGNSELDDYVDQAVKAVGRVTRPDPTPEQGSYYRSDHFSLAKVGVPAIYIDGGVDHVEKGEEWFLKQHEEYVANDYHKPSDEYSPDWDLSGAVEDLKLIYRIGARLANEDSFPNWRDGTEFKAKRDAMMK
ncbi:M28 family metallopeptidase [Luteithermobacter gelatinilyticus]|uniref:M28 family metallopeptidase n=1 Tax=Luteithermobacter gelatinilyticus TaxID=2582913 RepID=UPI00110676A1|nr:M28 family metallopeptidase [Luteithermobacter gelatinilyticus]